jgi:tripartite-type tricarboxylate transporter receptor subunit TctC
MFRKNQIYILMAFALMFSLALAGCGSGGNNAENKGKSAKQEIEYPVKAINMIVPYAPGGSSDMSARPVADKLGEILGKPVVIINKPGAGGGVGAAEVSKAKGDGYTLLNASIGPITIVPYTSNVGYTYQDFKAVAQLTDIPLAITVNKNSPIKTLKDYVDYAKKNPGKLTYGSPGAGNIQHITMEGFTKTIGIKLTHIPYEGANPAVAALIGNHVDSTCTGVSEVTGPYKAGEVRILGVTSEKRIDFLPDVPTFKEQGFDVVAGVWYGVLVPKDTPDEIVEKLSEALKQASSDERVLDAWKKLYILPAYLGPEDFAARIEKDVETNKKIIEDIGLAKK